MSDNEAMRTYANPNTDRTYKAALMRFLRFVDYKPDPLITVDDLEHWRAKLARTYEPSTINTWLSAVLSFLRANGCSNVADAFKLAPLSGHPVSKTLARAAIKRIFAMPLRDEEHLINALFYSGLGLGEFKALTATSRRFDTLHERARIALQRYAPAATGRLFTICDRQISRAPEKAGTSGKQLRASCAAHAFEEGASVEDVAAMLGVRLDQAIKYRPR